MDLEKRLLVSRGVTLFLDVGANVGQTGLGLRRAGYRGRIVSFEPLAECFAKLEQTSGSDPLWQAFHLALGETSDNAEIGVSKNLQSSSLLPVTQHYVEAYYRNAYTRHEVTRVERLDTLLPDLARPDDVIHLKMDTQGYERFVLAGASGVIDRIYSVRMEVAVAEMYEREMILPQAITMMTGLGFLLIDATPAFRDPRSGELLHLDLLFRRGGMAERHTAPPHDQSLKARIKRWNRERLRKRREGREAAP